MPAPILADPFGNSTPDRSPAATATEPSEPETYVLRVAGFLDTVLNNLRREIGCDAALVFRWSRREDKPVLLASNATSNRSVGELMRHAGAFPAIRRSFHNTTDIWLNEPGEGLASALLLPSGDEQGIGLLLGFETPPQALAMRRAVATGQMLMPCLVRCDELEQDLQKERNRHQWLGTALNDLKFGVCVVSATRKVEFLNNCMREILDRNDGLRLTNGAIGGTAVKDTVRLHVIIDELVERSQSADDQAIQDEGLMLAIGRSAGKRPLTVVALPAAGHQLDHSEAAAILLVAESDGDLSNALVPICRLNNLSPVETRLACHLTMGKSLSEASRIMHIKEQTARAYLRQIFQKTSTNRQADLIRMMMGSLLPVRPRVHVNAIM